MVNFDSTWNHIARLDNAPNAGSVNELGILYRESPIQSKPLDLLYYQFFSQANYHVLEYEVPAKTNIKKMERFCLDNGFIKRRTQLQALMEDPIRLKNLIFKVAYDNALMVFEHKQKYSTLLVSPDGRTCYRRESITTDPGYRKGMTCIADIETEEVYLRHFDNVYSVAHSKGYTHTTLDLYKLKLKQL
jgi:hypothetical protein